MFSSYRKSVFGFSPGIQCRVKLQTLLSIIVIVTGLPGIAGCSGNSGYERPVDTGHWLAGDHHIHTEWSVGMDHSVSPPKLIRGGDAIYPIHTQAANALEYGLVWIVITDHGNPGHSKLNLEKAYPELVKSRKLYTDLLQFWGMEFNTPGAEHTTLMVPHSHDEAEVLYYLESEFNRSDPWPQELQRDEEIDTVSALETMEYLDRKPLFIVNHPSRSAAAIGQYGKVEPRELRNWNDAAPDIAIGMSGAPGHQAAALKPFGRNPTGRRGGYGRQPTFGGFDQMTAIVGGFWDSMLGEGRRWWITANSDSHVHWRIGGADFWPGEYSKTYVFANQTYEGIIEGLRAGRIFVTLGDLISGIDFSIRNPSNESTATIGETLLLSENQSVQLDLRVQLPSERNANGDSPQVARIDIIVGSVTGRVNDRNSDQNPTTRVLKRYYPGDWSTDQTGAIVLASELVDVRRDSYVRIRGTNTDQLEPAEDIPGEDPWEDLWFYSNPIFIDVPPHNNLHMSSDNAEHRHYHTHLRHLHN